MSKKGRQMSKSLAVLGTAVASAVALALVLSTAPLLGQRGEVAVAGPPRCSGGGDGGSGESPTASPTPTQSRPGPIPTLPLPTGSKTPSPTGSASPSASASPTGASTPNQDAPNPAATTPTPTPTGTATTEPINPPPDSTTRCESKITISYASNRQRFSGEVRSAKAVCERGRRVQLRRDRDGSRRDPVVARTTTTRRGRYTIPLPDRNGRRFYTKVTRQRAVTRNGNEIVCLGDRSRTVSTKNPL